MPCIQGVEVIRTRIITDPESKSAINKKGDILEKRLKDNLHTDEGEAKTEKNVFHRNKLSRIIKKLSSFVESRSAREIILLMRQSTAGCFEQYVDKIIMLQEKQQIRKEKKKESEKDICLAKTSLMNKNQ
jgi:hypothetical protein